MPGERKYYVFRDDNCKFESMTKEQIMDAIRNAATEGIVSPIASVEAIKEINNNLSVRLWLGTQAEYNALEEHEINVLYIISDDESKEDLLRAIEEENNRLIAANGRLDDLEGRIGTAENTVEGISDTLTTIENNLDSLEGDIEQQEDDIQTLEENLSRFEAVIDNIREDKVVLLQETATFQWGAPHQTFVLSQSVSDFSKVVIKLKPENNVISNFIYYYDYVGTNAFVVDKFSSAGYVGGYLICFFSDDTLTVDNVIGTVGSCDLTIYGIV